jgi:hypothetical protein
MSISKNFLIVKALKKVGERLLTTPILSIWEHKIMYRVLKSVGAVLLFQVGY